MVSPQWTFSLSLMGQFRLATPDGVRVEIASTKAMALIAMLAVAKDGERSRVWLQDRLWGSRQRAQAQSSLRRELSSLRKCLNRGNVTTLVCEHQRVSLDLAQFKIDVRSFGAGGAFPAPGILVAGEFLEGIDIPGEEGFEEWLRDQRQVFRPNSATSVGTAAIQQTALPQTDLFVGQSLAAPRFGDRPALAVLPFANLTGEPANDYLSEGLSEDLIDRLSRLRWLPVIARNSSFAFVAGSADPRTVGAQLGARYVLEGRLRTVPTGYSIALALSDATTNTTFWTHRLPLPRERAQDALDPIVAELVGALDAQIDHAEQLRARGNRQNRLEFNDLIWRGRWYMNRLQRGDAEKARELFEQALALEPDSPEALIQATYQLGWTIWANRGGPEQIKKMRRLAHRALAADPHDGRGHMLAGIAELWLRQTDRARALLRRAVELNPSLCQAHAQLGCQFNLCGEPAAAIAPLRMAQRLSPNDIQVFFIIGELAMAYWMLGRHDEAIAEADQSLGRRPAYWYAAVVKINALLAVNDLAAARRTLDELLSVKPDFSPGYIDWIPFIDRSWNRRLAEGLGTVLDGHAGAAVKLRAANDTTS
jgi:TolB-like protein/Tfp pilus assembly protein PilF